MGLTRRELLLGGASLGAAASLSGCAGLTRPTGEQTAGGTGSGSSGPATLTFVNWSGETEKAAFDALIKAFTEANPEITIKTDTVPYDSIQTNLDSRFQSGNPPDLFRVSYIDIGQYTSQGVLLDVSSTFDQARIDEFEPGLWQAIVYDGKPYGVPHQIDTTAILYRKDAFEAAKITNIPESVDDAWTWEEFADAARKLKGVVKGKQTRLHLRLAERGRVPLAELAVPGRRPAARRRPEGPGDRHRRRPQGRAVHPELLHRGLGGPEHLDQEHDLPRRGLHRRLRGDGLRRRLPAARDRDRHREERSSTARCRCRGTCWRPATWAATRSWRPRTARTPRRRPSSSPSASRRTSSAPSARRPASCPR